MSESGSIRDHASQNKLGRKFIHYSQMSILMNAGTSLGNGTPIVSDIGDVAVAEQSGIAMSTADEVYGLLHLGELLRNPDVDMQAAIHFIVGETSKADIDWQLWVKGLAEGEAISDAKVSADASLTYPAQSNTLAGELVVTPAMGFGLTTELTSDEFLQFAIELGDDGTAAADKNYLVGIEFRYELQFSHADEVRQQL